MVELEVQKFLKSGNTLRQLAQKYNIQCNFSADIGLVALNYTNLSPMQEPIVQECRGLFLEIDTWNVACKSFSAFLRSEESSVTLENINWQLAYLVEKLDGALICMYYYKDKWNIGMRLSADGSMQVSSINGLPTALTFSELTIETIKEMGYEFDNFISRLNTKLYYSFELVGPETRFGVVYSKRRLVLIGAVDSESLKEIDIFTLDFPDVKPQRFSVHSTSEIKDIFDKYDDPLKYEGYVLVDDHFNRVKYRNPEYVKMMSAPVPDEELNDLELLLQHVTAFWTGC